jgi:hypothetical protein
MDEIRRNSSEEQQRRITCQNKLCLCLVHVKVYLSTYTYFPPMYIEMKFKKKIYLL